jgi:hypothetical protein
MLKTVDTTTQTTQTTKATKAPRPIAKRQPVTEEARTLLNWLSTRITPAGTVHPDYEDQRTLIEHRIQHAHALGLTIQPGVYLPRPAGASCDACGRSFGGVAAFDRHRLGEYEQREPNPPYRLLRANSRRCATDEELVAKGLRLNPESGQWEQVRRGSKAGGRTPASDADS